MVLKILNLIQNYLTNHQQRVLLNRRTSKWTNILPGVPQGSVLGPLLFLIYINNLSDGLKSICKIFADDMSLFAQKLMTQIQVILWFNPDIHKQATKVYFSQRCEKSLPPPIIFNKSSVLTFPSQKHVGLVLDSKLSFSEHVNQKIK